MVNSKSSKMISNDFQRYPESKIDTSQQSSQQLAEFMSKKDRKRERDALRRRAIEEKKEKRRLKDRERRLKQKLEKEQLKRQEEEKILFSKRRDEKVYSKHAEKKIEDEEKLSRKKINIEVQSLGLAYNRPRRKIKKPSYFSL